MTILTGRAKGSNSDTAVLHDAVLEAGAISINQDSYTAGLDRIYDIKGLVNVHVEIINSGSNPLTYKIEKARKNYNILTELTDADFNRNILPDTDILAAVFATGTVTLASVLAGDTVTINNLIYTAVAGVKANNTQFSIDGTDTVDAADLVDSITNDTRQGTLEDVSATNTLGVVTLTSTAIGVLGDAVTLVSSDGTRLAVSGATFTGGVNGFNVKDIVDISPESTAIRVRIRRKTAGQSSTIAGFISVD